MAPFFLHLRGSSPPALVSESEAAQTFSFGDPFLSGDFMLSQCHSGVFMLQLGEVLHAAVNLHDHTVGEVKGGMTKPFPLFSNVHLFGLKIISWGILENLLKCLGFTRLFQQTINISTALGH